EHTANWVPMEAGDTIVYDYGGGGGWGDPLDRDPQAVLDDVLDEYVSLGGAERDYGRPAEPGDRPGRVPRRHRRRRHVHRPHLRHTRGRGPARQDPDHTRRPVGGGDDRDRPARPADTVVHRRLLRPYRRP